MFTLQAIPSVSAPGVSQLRRPTAGKKSPQSSPPRSGRASSTKESPLLDSHEGKRKNLDPAAARKTKSGTSSGSQTPEPTPVSTIVVFLGLESISCHL